MAEFVIGEAARERYRELADQVDAAYAEMRELSSDEVGNAFRAELVERLETQERANRGLMYRMIGQIGDPPDETAMAPVLVNSLAARLRVPPNEVKRRMKMAARLRPRRQLTGPPLPPELPLVAAAIEAGAIGEDHLRAICRAIDVLPSCVSLTDRQDVEHSLVREATKSDAEIVKAAGRHIDEIFNPDGHFDEADRARRRGLHLGAQGPDGSRDCGDGSTPKPAPTSRRTPQRCARADTCPTAPWPKPPMTAAPPNAATTASNSGSRPASPPVRWAHTAAIRSP
jgi:Domain of unknown function (DUF222)